MKTINWRRWGTATTMTLIAPFTLAQNTPPESVVQQSQDEQEAAPKPKVNEITFGATSFRHSSDTLQQYARPQEGFGLVSLRLLSPLSETTPFAKLLLRGMPDKDSYVEGRLAFNRGNTLVRIDRGEFGHYVLDWKPKEESLDKTVSATVEHAFAPNIGAFATYESTHRDAYYPAPRIPDHTQTQTIAGGLAGNVAGGNADVSVTERRTYTGTGVQPTTLQRIIGANYSRDFSPNLSVIGSANFALIEQAGQQGSDVNSYALAGSWDFGPLTTVQFSFAQQDLDLNSILNAYVRQRMVTAARIVHHLPGWSMQVGYRHKESERLREDQSFVDVPKSDMFDFRVAGALAGTRVTLKGTWETVGNDAVMNTDDPRQLYWSDKSMFQAKLERGGDTFSAYGTYTFRLEQNDERGVEVGSQNFSLGGTYVFMPELTAYAEVAFDDIKAVGGAETQQMLDFYFPNSRTFAFGADWAKSPDLTASANLNFYESGDVRGSQLTFSVRQSLSPDNDLELTLAPWRHEDQQFDLTSFYSTIASARVTMRF